MFGICRIQTGRNIEITIGDECLFSWDIVLLGHDGHMIFDIENNKCINNTAGERKYSISIGKHVWVGGEVVILPGTNIGDGSLIGYRSMCKGIYGTNTMIAGSIAKVLRTGVGWSRENIWEEGNNIPDNIIYDEHNF